MVKIDGGQIEVDLIQEPGEGIRLVATAVGDDEPFVDLHFTVEEFEELVGIALN